MQYDERSTIPIWEWENQWHEFARQWAYARLENGPSHSADNVAIKVFSGPNIHVAAWVINTGKWHENPDVIALRNSIENSITKNDAIELCDGEAIKVKTTKALLDIMGSRNVEAKDKVSAIKALHDMYGLSQKNIKVETDDLARGAVIIPTLSVSDFANAAYNQQRELEVVIENKMNEVDNNNE